MNLLSTLFAAIEPLFFGLFAYIAPDVFMNPEDGIFKSITYVRTTSLDTNHIDPINRIKMMNVSAGLLSLAAMQFLAKNHMNKQSLLTTKLYNATLLLFVFLHAASLESPNLNPTVIGFYAGLHTTNVLWLTSETINYFKKESDYPRTPAKPAHIFTVVFNMIYVGYFGLMHIFNPQAFAPGHVMAYWNKTPLEDNALDDLFYFVGKLEGAILLTFFFAMLEILILDRSVERIRWNNTFATVAGIFYVVVWLRALSDTSGYVKRSQWIGTIVFEFVSLGVTLGLGPNILEKTPIKVGFKKTDVPVPELTTEKQQAKKIK